MASESNQRGAEGTSAVVELMYGISAEVEPAFGIRAGNVVNGLLEGVIEGFAGTCLGFS